MECYSTSHDKKDGCDQTKLTKNVCLKVTENETETALQLVSHSVTLNL